MSISILVCCCSAINNMVIAARLSLSNEYVVALHFFFSLYLFSFILVFSFFIYQNIHMVNYTPFFKEVTEAKYC